MKRYIVIATLFGTCLWSLWLRQQTFAVFAMMLAIAAVYHAHAKRILSILERLAFSATKAKFGDVEVQLEQGLERILNQLTAKSAWVHLVVSKLDGDSLTLLLSIARVDVYEVRHAIKPALRRLRDFGLIIHDRETLESSATVKATELGCELARALAEAKLPSDLTNTSHSSTEQS